MSCIVYVLEKELAEYLVVQGYAIRCKNDFIFVFDDSPQIIEEIIKWQGLDKKFKEVLKVDGKNK